MRIGKLGSMLAAGALALTMPAVAKADQDAQVAQFISQFDNALGSEMRKPQSFEARYDTALEQQIARLADSSNGRIGVYAIDLSNGREVGILADQRFPMASTSKVAIAATYLAGVDKGRWSLTSEFRLPRPGGAYLSARQHLDLMISKSCNACTDALLNAVGGPAAVNAWMRQAGIQ